jgi:deazaflavin-dependent oxidoreductase (nitroreductase family)
LKKTNPSSSSRDSSLDREQYLYLTTRGRKTALPREIEIWFTQRDGRLYVIAEHPNSQWVENLRAHPEGQVRVAGRSFKVRGRILSPEEPELRAVQELSHKKYGWGEGLVVELIEVETENREPATEN